MQITVTESRIDAGSTVSRDSYSFCRRPRVGRSKHNVVIGVGNLPAHLPVLYATGVVRRPFEFAPGPRS